MGPRVRGDDSFDVALFYERFLQPFHDRHIRNAAAFGVGGVLLLLLTTTRLDLGVKGISVVVMVLCLPWIYFSYLAKREYVATIRRRFESRRFLERSIPCQPGHLFSIPRSRLRRRPEQTVQNHRESNFQRSYCSG